MTTEMTGVVSGSWWREAACVDLDPEMFFPAPSQRSRIRRAVAVCCSCPVVDECLRSALRMETKRSAENRHGVWGGLTPEQRYKLARRGGAGSEVLAVPERGRL